MSIEINPYIIPGIKKNYIKVSKADYTNEALEEMLRIICIYTGQKVAHVKKRLRYRELVTTRQIFYYLARKRTKATFSQLGKVFNTDHSNVIDNIQRISGLMETDPQLKDLVQKVGIFLDDF